MLDMRKVMWLLVIPCHVFSRTSSPSGNCTGLSEITFQDIKDIIDKTTQMNLLFNKIADLEEQMITLKKYVPRVIFHARVSDGKNPVAQKRVIYDQVTINKGLAYNTVTGFFTAPVPGVYQFTYSLLAQMTSERTAVYLMRNDESQSYLHSILKSGQAQSSSMDTILSLNRDDQVWVRLGTGSAWSGLGALNFQGVLLEAEED
ncbi:complement C1q-like protein 4 [Hemiscyllium ocellatum]|uniref:complement C1q-like protein 4 n=1 Tax=Hemiscyllium ocellatum TaxID=170820 RepID=UPI0029672464|nr:complement C1q-like protein 4 [Hemiscyllium ocellatum]